MRPYVLDPAWFYATVDGNALELTQLGTAEVFTDPLNLAIARGHDAATHLEVRGVLVGDDAGGAVDLAMGMYAAPDGKAEYRSTDSLRSRTLAYSSATAPGSELVTNGAFATDTAWTKGDGWAIAAGIATHTNFPTMSRISQAVAVSAGNWYLLAADVVTAGALVRAWIGEQLVNTGYKSGGRQPTLFKRTASGENILYFETDGGGNAVLDNVLLKEVTPFRFHALQPALLAIDQPASGIAIGFLPAADLADNFLSVELRRYIA